MNQMAIELNLDELLSKHNDDNMSEYQTIVWLYIYIYVHDLNEKKFWG